MDKQILRQSAAGLGIATMLFGVTPLLLPDRFARVFGFETPDAATASMMRSLGVRDIVMGMGLWSAAAHGGNFAPWLLARWRWAPCLAMHCSTVRRNARQHKQSRQNK